MDGSNEEGGQAVSDTPRTDAAEYESQDEPVAKLGAVDADFARQLERELNAANERIKRLESVENSHADVLKAIDNWMKQQEAKEAKP